MSARPTRAATAIRAVLVDLDGTLLDTVDDITAAGNAMRAELGRPPLPRATVARFVGKGARHFVALAIAEAFDKGGAVTRTLDDGVVPETLDGVVPEAQIEHWLPRFIAHYARLNGTHAAPYPRAREGLAALRGLGLALACVTNKPRVLAQPLLERFDLRFDALVAGGDTPRGKPDPQPLQLACERLGIAIDRCVMLGDSSNDARAARAAGIPVLLVPYGYNQGAPIESTDADAVVPSLVEAARWIAERNLHAPS